MILGGKSIKGIQAKRKDIVRRMPCGSSMGRKVCKRHRRIQHRHVRILSKLGFGGISSTASCPLYPSPCDIPVFPPCARTLLIAGGAAPTLETIGDARP